MTPRSNIEWQFWGKQDPLWAVASWKNRNKDGANPWRDKDFYELGRSDWDDFVTHWEKYGVANDVAVEIGCGAGRLTKSLAGYFKKIHALDVSEDMISYAAKNIQNSNVVFNVTSGSTIPVENNSITAVFSTHVFQHLESVDDVSAYFAEIFRALAPGGTMMIHLPVHSWPYGAGELIKRVFKLHKLVETYWSRLKRYILKRGGSASLMRMHSYGIDYLYSSLSGLGFEDIEVCVFSTKSNDDPHPFVFARKPQLQNDQPERRL